MNNLPKPLTAVRRDIELAQERLTQIDNRLPKEYRDALNQLDDLKAGTDILMEHAEAIAAVFTKLEPEQRKHRQEQFMKLMKAHSSGHAIIILMQTLYAELHLMKKTRVDQITQSLKFQSELVDARKEIAELNLKIEELQNNLLI